MTAKPAQRVSSDPFERIRTLMYDVSGVSMNDSKRGLVTARVSGRIRALGLESFEAYADLVCGIGGDRERDVMVDLLTTNKTSFFRESTHFDYLRNHVFPTFADRSRPLRIWSAGCSSGEEAYTLAMVIFSQWPDAARRDIRILGTDLSPSVLLDAKRGVYSAGALNDVPPALRARHLRPVEASEHPGGAFEVAPTLRAMVSFAQLNLMQRWPMAGPFDVILCRNVMIYFDRPTRSTLVRRFSDLLGEDGHLLVGHSESLNGLDHGLQYVMPSVYRK